MNPQVKAVKALDDFLLEVQFTNSELKQFDVKPYLEKGIFKELKNEDYFVQVFVSFGAVSWPNEQDFSADTLYLLGV